MTLGQINFSPDVSALHLEVALNKLAATQQDLEKALKREAALRKELQQLKPRRAFVVCTFCDGVGFVLLEDQDGYTRKKCKSCGGVGEIDEAHIHLQQQ